MSKNLTQLYFDWLYGEVSDLMIHQYRELLYFLFNMPFYAKHPMDENRADDGINLRYLFGNLRAYPDYIIANELDTTPCSVLEMMVALAKRMETIAENPSEGNRTSKWFIFMLSNLGLSKMYDGNYDNRLVVKKVTNFMERNYKPNGEDGLFMLEFPRSDMRQVEIWYQAMWFLTEQLHCDEL